MAISVFRQRELAGQWHGGQWSALYAFCSSGAILVGLDTEIKAAIKEATGCERRKLRAFLAEIESCCDELREADEAAYCRLPCCRAGGLGGV